MRLFTALLFSMLLLCSCANNVLLEEKWSSDGAIYTPTSANNQRSTLNGQQIVLRGYLVHEPESYGVWDSAEAVNKGDATACVSLLYPKSLAKEVVNSNRRNVVIRGVFKKKVTSENQVFLGLCNYTGILISETR